MGYWPSALIFAGVIAAVAGAHYRFNLNAVAAFWIAYILTRPLGASLGDFLSQARVDGGLGLGTTATSAIFLAAILVVVTYLTLTRKDATEAGLPATEPTAQILVVAHKTAATPALLDVIRRRAADGATRFHLLVPNPAGHAELTDAERHAKHTDGGHVLALALPLIEDASGGEADGSVSIRHDPMGRDRGDTPGRRLPRDHPLDAPAQRLALAARRPAAPGCASRSPRDDRHSEGAVDSRS